MSVQYSAKLESPWGVCGRMDTQNVRSGIMNAPTSIAEILAGEPAGDAAKSTLAGAGSGWE